MILKRRKSAKAALVAHILTALVIIVHGYEKMEKEESSFWIFYVLGCLFLLIAAFHKPLASRIKWTDSLFHVIEAIVLSVIAYDYFHHGKTALPFCYLIAATGHLVAAFFKAKKGNQKPVLH